MFKHYTMHQVILPLDLEIKWQENELAFAVNDLVESRYWTFFGFLKANLGFTRLSLRGQSKAHNDLRFALLAVNLRKFTANNVKTPMNPNDDKNKNGSIYDKTVNRTIFYLVKLVMS